MVLEKSGRGIMAGLRQPDPFLAPGCQFEDKCLVEGRRSCWTTRIVYALVCGICGAQYVGTSGCSGHKRAKEHQQEWLSGSSANPMSKHWTISHGGEDRAGWERPFSMRILGAGFGSNLERYIQEAMAIKTLAEGEGEALNSKGEWGRVALRHLTVVAD